MPSTSPYGFEYEAGEGEIPARTLHGADGTSPILARQVSDELERVDADVSDVDTRVADVEAKAFLLDRVSLSGTVDTGTDVVIPSGVRGEFDSYVLEIDAHVSQSLRPYVVRVNGLADGNYRANCTAFDTSLTVQASSDEDGTSFPRVGFFGEFGAFVRAVFRPRSKGDTQFVQWISQGWANQGGSSSVLVMGGGRWFGDSFVTLSHFTVRTAGSSSLEDTWSSNSFATLWGRV